MSYWGGAAKELQEQRGEVRMMAEVRRNADAAGELAALCNSYKSLTLKS